jgi:hypothetical protein
MVVDRGDYPSQDARPPLCKSPKNRPKRDKISHKQPKVRRDVVRSLITLRRSPLALETPPKSPRFLCMRMYLPKQKPPQNGATRGKARKRDKMTPKRHKASQNRPKRPVLTDLRPFFSKCHDFARIRAPTS